MLGNFQELLKFRIDSGDEILKKHFDTAGKNRQYRSPIIQNQMIYCCKKYIQDDLADEIKDAGYFSIIADEAKDE